jgi:hypothetical protein
LIDRSLPDANGQLGGFARFSGAKFSVPPAGMGLLDVAGSHSRLVETSERVLDLLGLSDRLMPLERVVEGDVRLSESLRLRRYDSILLTRTEMSDLLDRMARFHTNVRVTSACCLGFRWGDPWWELTLAPLSGEGVTRVRARSVFFAGGRTGAHLLHGIGLQARETKGIDLGVRIELPERTGIEGLRSLGPDAKILSPHCRTFCLNSPGEMYWYAFEDIPIPGGIVADASCPHANVGLLYRASRRGQYLQTTLEALRPLICSGRLRSSCQIQTMDFGDVFEVLDHIYGHEVALALTEFKVALGSLGLVRWDRPHIVHLPLLDWYWPTAALSHTFRTSLPRFYVIGDAAGYARGLLQAAVSGWLAAEEFLQCVSS